MSIQHRIAEIESTMDHDDVTSLVYGVDSLRRALATATDAEAVPVRLALCPWLEALERYQDVAETAAPIAASPHASPRDQLWARYWLANASWLLDGNDPIAEFLEIIEALGDDRSPDATELGTRLWVPAGLIWPPQRFLSSFVPWAAPRFADAFDGDRWMIARRILDRVDALDDPDGRIVWLTDVLGWTDFDDREWGSPLRHQLALLQFTRGDFAEARREYLGLADTASGAAEETVVRMQAARAAARSGDLATGIRELGEIVGRTAGTSEERRAQASARVSWVEMLAEHAPADADREGLAMWHDLGSDDDEELAHLAGLALARSWNERPPEVIVERATRVISRFPVPDSPNLTTLVVMALNSRTRAFNEQGDDDAALADAERATALATDDVPDFVRATTARNREALLLRRGDYTERDEIYGVVRRLLDEANAASDRGDRDESARLFQRTFEMSQPSPDPATRLVGLAALQDWVVDLLADRDDARAADVARRSIEAGIVDEGPGTEILAQAWLQLGVAANRLADRRTAQHAFAQVSTVVGDAATSTLVELDSQARWNLAVLLDDGNAPQDALAAYQGTIALGSAHSTLAMQRRVAKALKNSAIVLRDDLNQPQRAGEAWNEIITRFDGHTDEQLSRLVAEAKQNAPKPPRRGLFGRRK